MERWLERGIASVCGVYLLAALAYGAWHAAGLAGGLDYGEGVILALVSRAGRGLSLYQDYRQYPYVYCAYGPVYLWLTALVGPTLAVGRMVSVVSAVVAAGCLAALAGGTGEASQAGQGLEKRGAPIGLISARWLVATVFLLSPFVLLWSPTMRVDMLAQALNLVGLWLAVRRPGLWSAPLFVAAFFTRQSMVAAPLAVAAWYFLSNRRLGLQFLVSWMGLVGLSLVVGILATGGQLWANLGSRPVVFDTIVLVGLLWDFIRLHWPLLLAAGWSAGQARDRTSVACLALMWTALAFAEAIGVSGISSNGATINYYIEVVAALALLSSCGLALPGRAVLLGLQVALIYGFVPISGLNLPPVNPMLAHMGPDEDSRLTSLVVAALREAPGEVLCENPGLAVLAGKEVVINDPFILGLLERNGRWQPDALVQAVRDRRFSMVVLQPSRVFPAIVTTAISENYRVKYRVGYDVLVPNER